MKKILLMTIVSIAFLSAGTTAQTIFIPRPPVIYIPQLDPVRMHIQNLVFRNMVTAASQRGGTTGAKKRSPAAGAVDYTMFNPRQENYLPKMLAQASKGNAAEQRQAEQFFNSLIERYEQGSPHHELPKNELAYALVHFILVNYEAYYDLGPAPIEKDPWAKRARTESHRTALMNEKTSLLTTTEEDRAMYYQFKEMLSAKPEFKKMTDKQKQEMTETLVIMSRIINLAHEKAIENDEEQLLQESHQAAEKGLEELLGVPIDKIKFDLTGIHLK
ncbi:MAG: hypothetical protein H0T08_08045 [Acidobacteria bacterium]|nr:hypothetical protein [Acidobacteriota bacterium]